jgi:hypothetical protein
MAKMAKLAKKGALPIGEWIHEIRGERVLLDSDLARIYGVSTKVFNQSIRLTKQAKNNQSGFIPSLILNLYFQT